MKTATLLLTYLLLFVLIAASCATSLNTLIPPTTLPSAFTHQVQPATTQPTKITLQSSLTPTKTFLLTNTSTSMPLGYWQIPVVDLRWAENGYSRINNWMDNGSIILENNLQEMVTLDAKTGNVRAVLRPTPEATFDDKASLSRPSVTDGFEITCTEAGLVMYHLPDRQLISEVKLQVSNCQKVMWASDSSAASFVTDSGEVYIWRKDGNAPNLVGHAMDATQAQWSPDNKRILIVENLDINLEATFNIAYPDGIPMKITGAKLEDGNEWAPEGLTWFTNDIVRNRRGCVIPPGYCVEDFYAADSGKFLIRNVINESGGQETILSPDQRWLVLEALPNAENWENRYTTEILEQTELVLYDLKAQKAHVWAKGEPSGRSNLSFEFIGWSLDSHQFYLTYYPFGDLSADLLAGYSVLDRDNFKTRLIVPKVIFDRLSPDGRFIFVLSAKQIAEHMASGTRGAILTLDGTLITGWKNLSGQFAFDELHLTDFFHFNVEGEPIQSNDLIPIAWNGYSTELVLASPAGELWLMDTNGKTIQLASDLPMESDWPVNVHFSWSPDGRLLMIQWGTRGWIAQIHAQ